MKNKFQKSNKKRNPKNCIKNQRPHEMIKQAKHCSDISENSSFKTDTLTSVESSNISEFILETLSENHETFYVHS